jgi:hypothetical protein
MPSLAARASARSLSTEDSRVVTTTLGCFPRVTTATSVPLILLIWLTVAMSMAKPVIR